MEGKHTKSSCAQAHLGQLGFAHLPRGRSRSLPAGDAQSSNGGHEDMVLEKGPQVSLETYSFEASREKPTSALGPCSQGGSAESGAISHTTVHGHFKSHR